MTCTHAITHAITHTITHTIPHTITHTIAHTRGHGSEERKLGKVGFERFFVNAIIDIFHQRHTFIFIIIEKS